MSASFTDLSSSSPLSPKDINVTIRTNRKSVVKLESTNTAKYLFISNSFMYPALIGRKIFDNNPAIWKSTLAQTPRK